MIATGNVGKVREIRAILARAPVVLRDLSEVPSVSFPDEGNDYEANALAKARAVAGQLGVFALADDSGLEVDALAGRPGPYSARFGGSGLDDAGRVAHLLAAIRGVAAPERTARFVCWAALATPAGETLTAHGECRGSILETPRGSDGFGYDPIFQVADREETMAQIPAAEKNEISHRAGAVRALFEAWLPRE